MTGLATSASANKFLMAGRRAGSPPRSRSRRSPRSELTFRYMFRPQFALDRGRHAAGGRHEDDGWQDVVFADSIGHRRRWDDGIPRRGRSTPPQARRSTSIRAVDGGPKNLLKVELDDVRVTRASRPGPYVGLVIGRHSRARLRP